MHKQVEGEAQGDKGSVEKFVGDLNQGPRLAHVVKLEQKKIAPRDDEGYFTCQATSGPEFHLYQAVP